MFSYPRLLFGFLSAFVPQIETAEPSKWEIGDKNILLGNGSGRPQAYFQIQTRDLASLRSADLIIYQFWPARLVAGYSEGLIHHRSCARAAVVRATRTGFLETTGRFCNGQP